MSYFSKYRHHYLTPERYTPDIARARRLAAVLEKERTVSPLLTEPLFRGNKNRLVTTRRVDNDHKVSGQKADLRSAAIARKLSMFSEQDFRDPALRSEYRRLRAAQQGIKSKPAGADKRQQYAKRSSFAQNVYGGNAVTTSVRDSLLAAASWLPVFKHATSVIPCIERHIRREVMFALGHGGRGYHKKKRRTEASGVPC